METSPAPVGRHRHRALRAVGTGLAIGATIGVLDARRRLRHLRQTPDPWAGRTLGPLDGDYSTVSTSDGAELGVVTAGEGPTVVLSHGLTAATRYWTLVAPRLVESGMRVVAYDQRGHGGSTQGSAEVTVDLLGSDLDAVIESTGVGEVTVVGHSMGGVSCLSMLARRQALGSTSATGVTSAVILASLARSPWETRLADFEFARWLYGRSRNRTLARLVAMRTFGEDPPLSLVDFTIEIFSSTPPSAALAAARALAHFDLRPALGSVQTPIHVLAGRLDRLTRPAMNQEIADSAPRADISWLARAGHQLPLEAADEVVGLITRTVTGHSVTTP